MEYLRKSGEKCQSYELIGKRPKRHHYPNIKYGDIVYEKNGYRAINAYVYTGDFECLSGMGPGNGSGGITKDISKHIENPITFYNMNDIYAGDIAEIELDTKAHMPILREEAGNRDISDKFEFVCNYYNQSPEINFESAKLHDGTTTELTLTSDLDDCYLTGNDFTDIDPITVREKKKNIELYEKNLTSVLLVGKKIYYQLRSKNSISSGFMDMINVKYDINNKPIEVIIENIWDFAAVKELKFIPINKEDDIPTWTCVELNIKDGCKMFEYDEKTKKYDFSLTLSDLNFTHPFKF